MSTLFLACAQKIKTELRREHACPAITDNLGMIPAHVAADMFVSLEDCEAVAVCLVRNKKRIVLSRAEMFSFVTERASVFDQLGGLHVHQVFFHHLCGVLPGVTHLAIDAMELQAGMSWIRLSRVFPSVTHFVFGGAGQKRFHYSSEWIGGLIFPKATHLSISAMHFTADHVLPRDTVRRQLQELVIRDAAGKIAVPSELVRNCNPETIRVLDLGGNCVVSGKWWSAAKTIRELHVRGPACESVDNNLFGRADPLGLHVLTAHYHSLHPDNNLKQFVQRESKTLRVLRIDVGHDLPRVLRLATNVEHLTLNLLTSGILISVHLPPKLAVLKLICPMILLYNERFPDTLRRLRIISSFEGTGTLICAVEFFAKVFHKNTRLLSISLTKNTLKLRMYREHPDNCAWVQKKLARKETKECTMLVCDPANETVRMHEGGHVAIGKTDIGKVCEI